MLSSFAGSTRGAFRVMQSSSDDANDSFRSTGSSLGGLGKLLAGGAIAAGFIAIGRAIASSGAEALQSYAKYERLSLSLQSLVARELVASSGTERYVAIGQQTLHLSDAQREKLQNLQYEYEELGAEIAVAEEHLAEATASGRDSTNELNLKRIRIEENKRAYAELGAEIQKLQGIDGKSVTVYKRVIDGQLSMNEAMKQAGPRAKELIGWIQQLAVKSPFSQDDVAGGFQLAMAYGFATTESQRLTVASVDLAAGMGASGEMIPIVARALGQMRQAGKATLGDINQLTGAGVPAIEYLADGFGTTTAKIRDMISQGLVPADKAIEAILTGMERDFKGAAEAQSNTFAGLLASLADLKEIGLREFFTGTFQAIQPYLADFVGLLSNPDTLDAIRKIGDGIGEWISDGLGPAAEKAKQFIDNLKNYEPSVASFVASIGSIAGGNVTTAGKAPVLDADYNVTVPGTVDIVSVNWTDALTGAGSTYTYDAKAGILGVDWTSILGGSDIGFEYKAGAGITKFRYNEEGFSYTYDANARIIETNVLWGGWTYTYDGSAEITKERVLWGLWQGLYSADVSITRVVWGAYFHIYDAATKIEQSSVLWGAWRHTYDGAAKIDSNSVLWGMFTHSYDAGAQITQNRIMWGLYTYNYNAGAKIAEGSILWGLFSHTYDATAGVTTFLIMGKTPAEFGAYLLGTILDPFKASWNAVSGVSITAPPWLQTLTSWQWPSPGAAPIWLRGLLNWQWPTLGSVDWAIKLTEWAWPVLDTAWITNLTGWEWPSIDTGWIDNLTDWEWPSIDTSWIDNLTGWEWPTLPTLPTWLGGSGTTNTETTAEKKNALGTSYWQGGGTWVGETGREWVNLPRGSQVMPNREAERMGGAVVHIYNPVLREDQDVRLLAAQVAEELDRRRR